MRRGEKTFAKKGKRLCRKRHLGADQRTIKVEIRLNHLNRGELPARALECPARIFSAQLRLLFQQAQAVKESCGIVAFKVDRILLPDLAERGQVVKQKSATRESSLDRRQTEWLV